MRLPEIRDRLHELADELGCTELHDLAHAMRRRYHGRQSVRSTPMTPELALAVASYAQAYPAKSMDQIAAVFNVNAGRVSEVLRGKRT